MPLSRFKNIVGSAATAAVLCYSYMGAPTMNYIDFVIPDTLQARAPEELNLDHYQLTDKNLGTASQQIEITHKFASNILDNIKDLDPEFSRTIDDNFWDLI